jgi:tRNA-specific 2-thiouridylase
VLYDGEVCLGGGIIEHAVTGQPAVLPQDQTQERPKKRRQKAALLGAR